MAVDLTRVSIEDRTAIQQACVSRLESLRSVRVTWWTHWSLLAEMFLPRRYKYFVTPNNMVRGSPINQAIVDETGLVAARTLATGLLAGLTSPTKPWFRLGLHGADKLPDGPVKIWLAECTRRMLAVYAESNLYEVLGQAYYDNVVFGSAAIIQYEDDEDIVRFVNPALGEFFFGISNRLTVDTLYREYTYTVRECVQEFGLENCSEDVRISFRDPASLDREVVICCGIEPNKPFYSAGREVSSPVPASFPYREVYWQYGSGSGTQRDSYLLSMSGVRECPFVGLRWDVTSNDSYGRSPGMDALPAVRQLQIEQRRKAEAIDKMVRPPMVASVSMKNEPMSILPGGVSYVTDPAASGFKPAFTVEPRIQELKEDLAEVQTRVRAILFNDLFVGITNIDKVQTATYVDAVREEKLILLGPVIERTENEGLDEILERTFAIMSRRGLFPPPPPEIAGMAISIQYISMLAEAQRAAATASVERLMAFTGSLVAVRPDVMDKINVDNVIDIYADLLAVPPEILNSIGDVEAIRAARAQQEAAQAAMQVGQVAVDAGKTLADTPLGAGQNALQLLTGAAA